MHLYLHLFPFTLLSTIQLSLRIQLLFTHPRKPTVWTKEALSLHCTVCWLPPALYLSPHLSFSNSHSSHLYFPILAPSLSLDSFNSASDFTPSSCKFLKTIPLKVCWVFKHNRGSWICSYVCTNNLSLHIHSKTIKHTNLHRGSSFASGPKS